MIEAGILTEDDRVELIEGEIIKMCAVGKPHTACVNRLNRIFSQLVPNAIVSVQNPLLLSDTSEPKPDVVLCKFREDFYVAEGIKPADALLVVEVADSSAQYDRKVKLPLYALAGVAEVWLVDLNRGVVEVYREPSDGEYQELKTYRRGEKIEPLLIPEVSLTVEEILG